jgi:hypothetical protein
MKIDSIDHRAMFLLIPGLKQYNLALRTIKRGRWALTANLVDHRGHGHPLSA